MPLLRYDSVQNEFEIYCEGLFEILVLNCPDRRWYFARQSY